MDIQDILELVKQDQGLSAEHKEDLLNPENKKKISALLSGTVGAGLGLALAKYKKMSGTAQTILSGLGFGAGVLIHKYYSMEKYVKYDEKTKMYDVGN